MQYLNTINTNAKYVNILNNDKVSSTDFFFFLLQVSYIQLQKIKEEKWLEICLR
jgi:hypothetical protein